MLWRLLLRLWYEFVVIPMAVSALVRDWRYMYRRRLPRPELPSQEGRVAVVTGGSRGIGLEAVRTMLKQGMHLIVGSSSPKKAEAVLAPVEKETTEAGSKGKLEVWPLDLAKQASVRTFCQRFLDSGLPLHVLLCNAGIMFYPKHELTEDGIEMQLAVNHMSHLLMQHLLYPRLLSSGTAERAARIVNVSSAAHSCGGVNPDDIMMNGCYSPKGAYYQSKGAQIMCTKYLARKASEAKEHVTCTSLHPGVIYTDLYDHTVFRFAGAALQKLWKSPKDGAETLLHAALSPEAEGQNGVHFENAAVYGSAAYTEDQEMQQRVWDLSLKHCKITTFGHEQK